MVALIWFFGMGAPKVQSLSCLTPRVCVVTLDRNVSRETTVWLTLKDGRRIPAPIRKGSRNVQIALPDSLAPVTAATLKKQ